MILRMQFYLLKMVTSAQKYLKIMDVAIRSIEFQ